MIVAAAAGLATGAYLLGAAAALAVIASLVWGAWRLRAALVPDWSGAPARLAETVLALAALLASGQLLGSVGWLRPGPVLVLTVVAGLTMGLVSRRIRHEPGEPRAPVPTRREEVVAAAAGVAVVAAQWTTHAAHALRGGMTEPDTLWYHAPFAARFLQRGSFTGLEGLGYASSRFFPFNSELTHALAILPFGRDVLSPLLNLGWAALALLSAWCIGHRRGVGPLCVLGAALVLGLPVLAGGQPGQATNDVACAALLLAAVALLLEGGLAPAPIALAAVAAGLAVGTKLTVGASVAVLSAGVVGLALRARRPAVAGAWCASLALFGSCWFLRNWVVADNPVPWVRVQLGPLTLPAQVTEGGSRLVETVANGAAWRRIYLAALTEGLGRGWPIVLGLALAGVALAVVRARTPLERLVGVAALAGSVAYTFLPLTGGVGFMTNLRYLSPALLVAVTLLPLTLERAPVPWRRAAGLAMIGAVVLAVAGPQRGRVTSWPTDGLVPGALVGLGVLGTTAVMVLTPRWSIAVRGRLALVGVLLVVVGAGGWAVQRRYLERRYVASGLPFDPMNAHFRNVRDSTVAVFGNETYPLFGLDLSNRITQLEGPQVGTTVERCRASRRMLSGRYRYILLEAPGGFINTFWPDERWFRDDPAATEVVRKGRSVLFRVDGALDPSGCR